jgi:hypothetical protein
MRKNGMRLKRLKSLLQTPQPGRGRARIGTRLSPGSKLNCKMLQVAIGRAVKFRFQPTKPMGPYIN